MTALVGLACMLVSNIKKRERDRASGRWRLKMYAARPKNARRHPRRLYAPGKVSGQGGRVGGGARNHNGVRAENRPGKNL